MVTIVHSKPKLLFLAYLHRGGTKWFMLCLIFKVCIKLDFKFIQYRNVSSFFRSKCNCSRNCQKLGVMSTSFPLLQALSDLRMLYPSPPTHSTPEI